MKNDETVSVEESLGERITENRRHEDRRYYTGIPVLWRKQELKRWHHDGMLHDDSTGGIGFLVPDSKCPKVGQDIEIVREDTNTHLRCTIVRTEAWWEDQLLVGGRLKKDIPSRLTDTDKPHELKEAAQMGSAKEEKVHQSKEQEILELWKEFKENRSDALRNRLLEHYLPLVRYNARRVYMRLPDKVEYEDLVTAGIFGLISAIEAYDLQRNVKFSAYCTPRIRGAILDELRSMDWVPRLVRSRAQKLNTARKEVESEKGRAVTDEELAKKMGISVQELMKLDREARTISQVSLSQWVTSDNEKHAGETDILADKSSTEPIEEIQRLDLKDALTAKLSHTEKLILVLYYCEEMTMREIALTLGMSESQVSQNHASILTRLQDYHRRIKNR